jgi:ABC-type transport system involved in cytochrome c biogenesis ATPase subunit
LQDAARRIAEHDVLVDDDFVELLQICKGESASPEAPITFSGLPAGALAVVEVAQDLRLNSISNVRGVNALSSSKPLEFGGSSLCVVYGGNGSGKSGYVRLLKHACGVRNPGELLGNVFAETLEPRMATFGITAGAGARSVNWTGDPLAELKGVDVYDTPSGQFYVDEESEVTFEPWLLRLFSRLTEACGVLSRMIGIEIAAKASAKPMWPTELGMSPASDWYARLSERTSEEEVAKWTRWTEEDEGQLRETEGRLTEANHAARAQMLRRRRELVDGLTSELRGWIEDLSDARCNVYRSAYSDAVTRRHTADEDARRVFESAPVEGVGSESWRLLWEAARVFSEERAYPQFGFPRASEGAHCVLCQQELSGESSDRMMSFEMFVKNELQQRATQAEELVATLRGQLPLLPGAAELSLRTEAVGLPDGPTSRLAGLVGELEARKRNCLEMRGDLPLPAMDVLREMDSYGAELRDETLRCEEDARGQNRPGLESKRRELAGRKWLWQQRDPVRIEVRRTKAVANLEKADRLTNTHALSRRKSDLAEELVSKAYVDRFRQELKGLGATRVRVQLKRTRTEVGRVFHRMTLERATTATRSTQVLSEGELRLASLAAFVADSEGRGARTPFVLDDPISSLDHTYEEAVARRIVALAQGRQVIVFTHRLSLLEYIRTQSEKTGLEIDVVSLSRYGVGEVGELPIDLQSTSKAVNGLANDRLAGAKKVFGQDDTNYEVAAKALCRDIRVLLERVVEQDLLNGVVRRFNREVHTKGKIHALARIEDVDCRAIDDLITKYSIYEHSQPEEAPVPPPNPDEVEADLVRVSGLVDKLRRRNREM